MAITLTISLLSLSGIPPFMGFFGKYYLFFNTINKGLLGLSIFAILAAVVGVVYYLRIANLVFASEADDSETISIGIGYRLFLILSIAATLTLGIFPSLIYRLI